MTLMLKNVDEKTLQSIEQLRSVNSKLEIIKDESYIAQAQKDYEAYKAGELGFINSAELENELEASLAKYEAPSL
ncbi:hypothetical protein [Helicobacter sp.]|uniref:hypothetical protein n=1 Tax=Helicobacter sp. TaxID=218 RepID=UPI0038904671